MARALRQPAAGAGLGRGCTLARENSDGFLRGSCAKVEHGEVNYKLWGKGDGSRPLVVTLHGLLGSMSTYTVVARQLMQKGYDVLTFDLFGFGLSDSPGARFDAGLFTNQTEALLAAIGYPEGLRFSLLGYSMGGLIAMEIALRRPGRVDRVVLVAPAGLVPLSRRERSGVRALRAARLLKIPVVSMAAKFAEALDWDTESFEPDMESSQKSQECAAMNERRFRSDPEKYITAWLKSVRDMRLGDSRKQYAQLAETGAQVLFVWGDSDAIVPLESVKEELRGFFPTAPVAVLKGVGHGILVEQSEAVADMAADWFRHGRDGLRGLDRAAAGGA